MTMAADAMAVIAMRTLPARLSPKSGSGSASRRWSSSSAGGSGSIMAASARLQGKLGTDQFVIRARYWPPVWPPRSAGAGGTVAGPLAGGADPVVVGGVVTVLALWSPLLM